MANIKIEPANVRRTLSSEASLAKKLQSLSQNVDSIRNALNYKIAGREQISARLRQMTEDIMKESTRTTALRDALEQIVSRYEQAESKNLGLSTAEKANTTGSLTLAEMISNLDLGISDQFNRFGPGGQLILPSLADLFGLINFSSGTKSTNGIWNYLNGVLNDVKDEKDFLTTVKTFLGISNSWGGDKEAGLLKNAIGYVENFANFFTGDKKGLTGASDLCKLTDSSISLWKGAYDYCRNMYKEVKTGFFGDAANQKVAILGLTGGFWGLIGSVASASKDLDEKQWQSIVADYMDAGKNGITIFNSAYTLKHLKDAKSLANLKSGPWSALNVYTSIAQGTLATVQQGFRSHEKYYADGKWDLGDTGATGIDVSLAGIYGIGHALSLGLDDVIYSQVEKLAGGDGNSGMSYVEQAAEGYKILGEKAAEKIVEGYNATVEGFRNLKSWLASKF